MKKIYLSFVLSIVSVFSILAQTSTPSSDKLNDNPVESVGTDTVETAKTTGKINETDFSVEKEAKEKPVVTAGRNPATSEEKKAADQTIADPAAETVKKPADANETGKKPATIEPLKQLPLPQQTPRITEIANLPGLPASAPTNTSLGGLSTGNTAVDGYIEEFSALYEIDPLLIYAQMSQESSFKRTAVSPKGASGFMQLMPDTARRFGVTNIYNPKQNIKAGVKYMRWLLDKFGGDPRLALAGYNAGEGAVMKHGNRVPPYRETQNYVTKIMNHYDLLSNQGLTVAGSDR